MEKFAEKQQKVVAEAARQHLFDAVIRVTQQDDGADFTMQQVAQEAGMAIGSLYHYFENKDALLTYVFKRLVGMHRERQYAIACGPGTVLERLERLAVSGFQFGKNHVIFFRIFDRSGLHNFLPEEEKRCNINEDIDHIKGLMAEGISDGVLKPMDLSMMARIFFTCMVSFFSSKYVFADCSAEEVGKELIRLFEA